MSDTNTTSTSNKDGNGVQGGGKVSTLRTNDEVQALRERLERQDKQIELLLKVADKHRLSKHAEPTKQAKKIRVRTIELKDDKSGTYNKKLIVGWSNMVKNAVTPKTAYDNDTQIVEIHLHDGTSTQLTYHDFSVTYDMKDEVDVIKIVKEEDGKGKETKIYHFAWEGETYQINELFIN